MLVTLKRSRDGILQNYLNSQQFHQVTFDLPLTLIHFVIRRILGRMPNNSEASMWRQ
jgi:hypothetical protein